MGMRLVMMMMMPIVAVGVAIGTLRFMRVGVAVFMTVPVRMTVFLGVTVGMSVRVGMRMGFVAVGVLLMVMGVTVNIEFHPFDFALFTAANVQVVLVQSQLGELVLEVVLVNAEINQRAVEHVAADAAKHIEVEKLFHGCFKFVIPERATRRGG